MARNNRDKFDRTIDLVGNLACFDMMKSIEQHGNCVSGSNDGKFLYDAIYTGLVERTETGHVKYSLTKLGHVVVALMSAYVDSQEDDIVKFDRSKIKKFASRVEIEDGGPRCKIRDYVNANSSMDGKFYGREMYNRI